VLNAQAEFDRRDTEINEYIQHLQAMEDSTGMPISLVNTMKSSALLMIYNIVESTMTNLLQDVFDHLQAQKVPFGALNSAMRIVVLGYAKRRSPKTLVSRMEAEALDLVVASFDRSDLFSGNLDCAAIRDTLREIGITSHHTYKEAALHTIKKERNDLAHGIKSFGDCGKSYTAKQLREFHAKTKSVLVKVISDFEGFLKDKGYA
jgi:hypothetical protein